MNQTERLYRIEQLIKSRRIVPTATLLDELEVSRATLKRDITYLRDRLHSPIIYDRDANGYRFDERNQRDRELPGLWFNPSEIHALLTVRHLIATLQPGLLQRHIEPLMERLQELMSSADHSAEEIERRVRIIHLGRRAGNLKFFEMVAAALLNRQRLALTYCARGTDATTEREVSPQRLVYYRESWYLDAWCHLRQDLRSFALDGIRQAKVLEAPTKDIAAAALDEHFADAYGIFSGRARHTAVLRFTPERARWVAAEEWHSRQKARFQADGAYVLEVPYGDDRELLMDILKFGADVEVLAPPELRARVAEALTAARRRYRKVPLALRERGQG
jgi:predicted DNA-binding transcriptional regulator YafY